MTMSNQTKYFTCLALAVAPLGSLLSYFGTPAQLVGVIIQLVALIVLMRKGSGWLTS